MSVESIGSVHASQQAAATEQNALGQEDFMRILLTQLSYQDPLKPMENQDFIAQLAQFAGLEQNRQVNDKMESLLLMQSGSQSLGLLGKSVEVGTATGAVLGEVISVSFQQGLPLMSVRTSAGEFLTELRPSQISLVRNPTP